MVSGCRATSAYPLKAILLVTFILLGKEGKSFENFSLNGLSLDFQTRLFRHFMHSGTE